MKNLILNDSNVDKYIEQIALIHKNSYDKDHFTSNFSTNKLEEYYRYLIKNSDLSIVSVDENNNSCLGFIIAGESVSNGIVQFVSKNRLYLFKIMSQNPSFFIEKIFSKFYTKIIPSKGSKAKFRLLSISVQKDSQSKGIGKNMLNYFEKELLKSDIHCYGLSVKKSNTKAIKFYINNDFRKEKEYMGAMYYYKKFRKVNQEFQR
jgi:ribosomal protein S18 acetylase RimI-like enzyme